MSLSKGCPAVPQSRSLASSLSYHNLLRLDIVALDEAEDIHTRGHAIGGDGVRALVADEHATHQVNELHGGVAIGGKDPFAAVVEGEGRVGLFVVEGGTSAEHQLEARRIVAQCGLEAVGRLHEQVDIGASEVIDEVEIAELGFLGLDVDGVVAVLVGQEVTGLHALLIAVGDGVVLAILRDVESGIVGVEDELGQAVVLVETDDSLVDAGHAAHGGFLHSEDDEAQIVIAGGYRFTLYISAEFDLLSISFSYYKDRFAG